MIKVTYRMHKGRRFRKRVTILKFVSPRMDEMEISRNWRKPESNRDEATVIWARARRHETWAIQLADGSWRYCFGNVAPKHVKKWLDYFAARY